MGNSALSPPSSPRGSLECHWLNLGEMAQVLGISRSSLSRLKARGFFEEGVHFRKAIPTSRGGPVLWHRERTAERMNAR